MGLEFVGKTIVMHSAQSVEEPNPKRSQPVHGVPPSGLAFGSQKPGEDFRRLVPFLGLFAQLPLSGLRQLVELRAPVVFRAAPSRADIALLFQLQKSRVKRSVIQRESIPAGLLNAPRQPVPVLRSQGLQSP